MGEIYALITAVIWGAAVILLKRSGEKISPFALNLFRVVVSFVLLAGTLAATGGLFWDGATWSDYLILFASGIIAIAISDTLFHYSLNMVGAGISAIVDCLYSPFTVILAFLLLDERLTVTQLAGMLMVLGGVLAVARTEKTSRIPPRDLLWGVILGVLSMFLLALGIVIAKPVLNRAPVLWATTVRQMGCLLVMLPGAFFSRKRREILSVFIPSSGWKMAVPGAVLGSYFSLLFWIAGMKYAQVGVAAILNQSSTIYVLLFAAIFLKEPLTTRKVSALVLALAGIMLVTFG